MEPNDRTAPRTALVMCDRDGVITHWDAAAEEYFGHASTDAIGAPVRMIVPEEFRDGHDAGVARAMAGGARHLEGAATHLPVLHADGAVVCHPARFNHVMAADGSLVAAVAVVGPPAPGAEPWSPIDDAADDDHG